MAIISTEAVGAPIEAAPGAAPTVTTTVTETPDAGADGEAAPVVGDLEILAEIEAQQGAPGADGSHTPAESDSTSDPATEAPAADKPDAEEPPAPAVPESADVRKARAILAQANRKLARANQVRDQVRNEIVARLRTKPTETLRELGTSIGELLDAEPGDPAAEAKPQTPEDRIAALEKRARDAEEAAENARVNAEFTAAVNKVHNELRASKDFPRINAGEAHGLVTELMVEYHATHGRALPAAKAAAIVENYLGTIAGAAAKPNSPAPTSKAPPSNGKQPAPQRQGSQTLANNEMRNVGQGPDDLPMDLDARVEAVMREMGLGLNH
jgi:hypothetical protein